MATKIITKNLIKKVTYNPRTKLKTRNIVSTNHTSFKLSFVYFTPESIQKDSSVN